MSQNENNAVHDPAFRVAQIDTETGETTIVIQKGIIGAIANQLKNTSTKRKGSSIIRKLGYVLSECGDIQYGKPSDQTDTNTE